jgi:hypothetical protein
LALIKIGLRIKLVIIEAGGRVFKLEKKAREERFQKALILVRLYSVFSVYSVVPADDITTEYTENTETEQDKQESPIAECPNRVHQRKFKLNPRLKVRVAFTH